MQGRGTRWFRDGSARRLNLCVITGLVLLAAGSVMAGECASPDPDSYDLRLSSAGSLRGGFAEFGLAYSDAGSGPDREWISSKKLNMTLVSSLPYSNWGGTGVEETYNGTIDVHFERYQWGNTYTRDATFEFELKVQWVYFPVDGLDVFANTPSITLVSGEGCTIPGPCNPWTPELEFVILCSSVSQEINDPRHLEIVARMDCAGCLSGFRWMTFPVGESAYYVPKAPLEGLLHSALPLALEPGAPEVRDAHVDIFRQEGFIQERQPGETEAEYQERLRGELQDLGAPIAAASEIVDLDAGGEFHFDDLPMFRLREAQERSMWQPALYMVSVSNASTIESLSGSETWTTKYLHHLEPNLLPDPAAPVNDVYLTPFDNLSVKKDLISQLIELSPNNYQPIEEQVETWVDGLVAGTPTEAQLEGAKRAIWAERTGRDGALFGKKLIGAVLDGYASLYGNLLSEVFNKVGTSKSVAKEEAALSSLRSTQSQRLRDRGWLSFTSDPELDLVKDSIKRNIKENPQIYLRTILGVVKKGLKAAFALLHSTLIGKGIDPVEVDYIVDGIQLPIMTTIDLLMTEGLGTAQQAAGTAAKYIIKSLEDNLFDDDMPYSYCDQTEEFLDYSRQRMESWPVADPSAYQSDRQEAVDVLTDMGRDVSNTLIRANWASTISTSGDFVESAADLFKSTPIGRIFYLAGMIAKWAGSVASFIDPLVATYLLPGTVEEGIYKAYGDSPPTSSKAIASPRALSMLATPNPNLAVAVTDAATVLDVSLAELITHLEADDIQTAILTTSGSGPDTVLKSTTELVETTSHFLLQGSETQGMSETAASNLSRLVEQNADMLEQSTDLGILLRDLYFRVLLLSYNGPTDPHYKVERLHVVWSIERYRTTVVSLANGVVSFAASTSFLDTHPVLAVDDLELVSDLSGDARVTVSPESFTLSARVRNLATLDVGGVSARLTINSPEDSVTATSPLEVTVGGGLLTADDGVDASGPDEANVQWTFDFGGSLSVRERATLVVELLENGANPASFVSSSEMSLLTFDHSLVDSDWDGIPDDYEDEQNLVIGVNDSETDLDSDGISNGVEWRIFTAAGDPDTDDDTLLDGEETNAGADGFVTDPLKADTDGDGEPDATDGHPLDPTTIIAPDPAEEPTVAVDTVLVTLTEANPMAIVNVSNASGGILQWAAHSQSPAIATASPNIEQIRVGDGPLLIAAPNGLDFTIADGLVTAVRVIDMLGTTADEEEIVVRIGSGPPPSYELLIDLTGPGTGTVTSDDGGISCGSDCSEFYSMGTEVTLTAVPAGSFILRGWRGDADCADGVVFTNINKSCTAVFDLNPLIFRDGFESGSSGAWSNTTEGRH